MGAYTQVMQASGRALKNNLHCKKRREGGRDIMLLKASFVEDCLPVGCFGTHFLSLESHRVCVEIEIYTYLPSLSP